MREMVYLIGWHAVPADGGFDFVDRDHKRALSPVNSMYAIKKKYLIGSVTSLQAPTLSVCWFVGRSVLIF